jgi:multiple sugar transport system permease protein/raffinose/stachyose/melibiose transport system permease protein
MSHATALGRRRRAVARASEQRWGYLMVAPAVVLIVLFLVIPVLMSFGLSVTNARLVSPNAPDFVGLDNFVRAFTEDPSFLKALRNVTVFALVVVPLQGGLGLVLALLVNQKLRGVTAFRVLFFMPVVTSMVVVSMLWRFMYQRDGLINSVFGFNVDWLNNPATALPSIIVMSVWQGVGFHMVIWLSGLQTIANELYEAARIDGAGGWQQFRNVTIPGLRPTFVFIFITITIAAFSLFVQVDIMTQGGPLDATTSIVYQTVQSGYRRQQVGYGAALSLIFFVLVLLVTIIQRRLTREDD